MPVDRSFLSPGNRSGRAILEVCLGQLRANVRRIAALVHPRRVIAVVKGDAYGHGAVAVARAMVDEGVCALATGSLQEAVAIRDAGVELPIVLLGNLAPGQEALAVGHRLTPSVSSKPATEAVEQASGTLPTPVYVKVDMGFGRFGMAPGAAREFIQWVAGRSGLRLEGVYTHLPFQDAQGQVWAQSRLREFASLLTELAESGLVVPVSQAISSPGVEAGLPDCCNTVACGSLLFGLRSLGQERAVRLQCEPVSTAIRCRIASVVSGLADRENAELAPYLRHGVMATGTVPVGLAQGLAPVHKHPEACMLHRGQRVPVLRVCLEHTILDLSGLPLPEVGEEVILLGSDGDDTLYLRDLARWSGASPMATLVSLGSGLERRYIP